MREIKFRVYNDIQNYMEQVDRLDLEDLADEENRAVNMHYMQYTGLKDKNGKEIYEGDIVTAENTARPLTVFYCVDRAAYRMGYRGEDTQYDKSEPIYDDDYCEVIGNIYENKDLLS